MISHISEGLQETGTIFLIGEPEVLLTFAYPHSLLPVVTAYIDTGITEGVVMQELGIDGYPHGWLMLLIQRNPWVIKVGNWLGKQIVERNFDPVAGIGAQNQRLRLIILLHCLGDILKWHK